MASYVCKKFSSMTYTSVRVHLLRMDGWTVDGWTDGWVTVMPIDRPLLKYGQPINEDWWKI